MNTFEGRPIGYFHTQHQERYDLPRQGGLVPSHGKILLLPRQQMEQAVEDLKGFNRIWVIFWFHRNQGWKPKVMPPRGGIKRGVFATRSPHRPNPIGLSCLELVKVEGLELHVASHDLLDGTPILDIKPYLTYADCFPNASQGWLESVPSESFTIHWDLIAAEQKEYLAKVHGIHLQDHVEATLSATPYPYPSKRIESHGNNRYELAHKSWRLVYSIEEKSVMIHRIASGYKTLDEPSKWDDIPVHRAFVEKFCIIKE